MNSLEIKNTSKNFGSVCAVNNISLTFEENKIYGLLGRNGAGKSTLLNIVASRIFADKGEILVDGENAIENDRAMGKIYMMSEKNCYPENMRISKAFKWTAMFYPNFDLDYAMKLAKQFDLKTSKKIKSLSTGYGSIFRLITALSTNAPYIFLDEPVLGLDANHRELFYRSVLEKFANNPSTIVISTHLIEEVAGLIDQVIIIKDGQVIKNETREELLSKGYTATGAATVIDSFTADKKILGTDALGGLKTVYILGTLDKTTVPAGIEITKMDLQRLFIQLTNT